MSGLGQKAPAFIFIFPLELLVVSRIVVAFAKLTKWSWIYRVFAEIGLPPRVLLCWSTMVCFAVQSWLGLASDNCVRCVCFAGLNLSTGLCTARQFYFLVAPRDWCNVSHRCGMPCYRDWQHLWPKYGCLQYAQMLSAENCNTAINAAKKFRAQADLLFAVGSLHTSGILQSTLFYVKYQV